MRMVLGIFAVRKNSAPLVELGDSIFCHWPHLGNALPSLGFILNLVLFSVKILHGISMACYQFVLQGPEQMPDANGNGTDSGQRTETGQFVKGHRGLGGRKLGSRNRLSESFLADLHAEWKRSGKKVLARVAESEPAVFLRVVGQILPKALEVDSALTITARSELAIEVQDFATAYEKWGKFVGANVPLIEAEAIDNEAESGDEQSDNE